MGGFFRRGEYARIETNNKMYHNKNKKIGQRRKPERLIPLPFENLSRKVFP